MWNHGLFSIFGNRYWSIIQSFFSKANKIKVYFHVLSIIYKDSMANISKINKMAP